MAIAKKHAYEVLKKHLLAGGANEVEGAVIVVPHKFESLNVALRANHNKTIRLKKEAEVVVWQAWNQAGRPRIPGRYRVTMTHGRSNNRFDPSNIWSWAEKVILDALSMRHSGCPCLDDDSAKYHKGTDHRYDDEADTDFVRVEIISLEAPF